MHTSFTSILIPVDFSVNTEVAICKALEIADPQNLTIHLLHVCRQSLPQMKFGRIVKSSQEIEAEIKLKEWQQTINDYRPSAKVEITVVSSILVQDTIAWQAMLKKTDLIVIGKKNTHALIPFFNTVFPTRLSKKTEIPVLTVKPGSLHQKIKNVVVPVNEQLPFHKLEIIKALSKKNRIRIFLVSFMNGRNIPDGYSPSALIRIHQWLKATLHCPTEYSILMGNNKVKSILQFAEENNADILLLSPGSETTPGWPGKYISDMIPRSSKVQVLTVQQAHNP